MELGRNYDILTWRLQGACSASELTQHIKLWLMRGLGHPVLTHSDNVQARFLLQNSEEVVRMHDLITPYVVGKAALEAAVTSKSQAWRGPSSPTSRYKVEKFIREYNFLVEILIWANFPKHAVYR